ncbi:PASTA domain-containing protein [Pseudomonas chlororaphis]|uniref:PASTA domain-containing protein n=1 Tax=Pseudomonas chlororaphis TaxID=587753 RepID=UPI000D0F8A0F|nr:PASTA domain-containing protein [Pseudomonas chlororaphis]AVO59528.1 hypothetical protein C6Q18_16685 [Pseudomonas chlororaphis subsp. piscium]
MPMTSIMPFKGAGLMGRGIDMMKGDVLGDAVDVVSVTEAVPGMEVMYNVQIVESYESLMENLGLDIQASGRYGMVSADARFKLDENVKFNSQSTFVVAKCVIRNAQKVATGVTIKPLAQNVLEDSPQKFEEAYGQGYVRGIITGGELYIVFSSTSTRTESQKKLSASFQAECQGLAAKGSFKTSYDQSQDRVDEHTSTSIFMYQRGGIGEQAGFVKDADEIIKRLKTFPESVHQSPVGYAIEVASYKTVPLQVNEQKQQDRIMSLTDCARLRIKYMTIRNDIQFARENPVYFADLTSDAELAEAEESYTRAVVAVQLHAQAIAEDTIPPTIFDAGSINPPLVLKPINFKRINLPDTIAVPNLVGSAMGFAKDQLQLLRLQYNGDSTPVKKDDAVAIDVVINQDPPAGTEVQLNSRVRLSYNYIRDERFPYLVGVRERDDQIARFRIPH